MTIVLNELQSAGWREELSDPSVRRILYHGSARSGKTLLIASWLCAQALAIPRLRILAARFHRTDAKSTLWNGTFRQLLGTRGLCLWHESDLEMRFRNGSVIRVDGLDDDDRVDKHLGSEYGVAFLNECSQLSWPTVQLISTRLTQDVPGLNCRRLILDCNPRSVRHWAYRWLIQHIDPSTGVSLSSDDVASMRERRFRVEDNPSLPEDGVTTLRSLTGLARIRLYDGNWCDADRLIYKQFSRSLNVATEAESEAAFGQCRRWIIGLDPGFTHPTGILLCGEHDGKIWVFREWLRSRCLQGEVLEAINQWITLQPVIVVDPSQPSIIAEMAAKGWNSKKADNAVEMGISRVQDGFTRRTIMLSPGCRLLAGQVENWMRDDDGKPEKLDDDLLDPLRYVINELSTSSRPGRVLVF